MQFEHFFGGSALATVGAAGRVRLPRFVREVAERRSDSPFLVLGRHESDGCLIGYDPTYRRMLFADSERLRLAQEPAGSPDHARARRAFGLTEQVEIGRDGSIALPPMSRRFGRIDALALFVGTGGAFEIWNPQLAMESGDVDLAELARWRLGHDQPISHEREE